MKKETLFFLVVALVIGILIGVIVGNKKSGPTTPSSTSAPATPTANYEQIIKLAKEVVAQDPSNRNAWIKMAHAYHDTNRYPEAITAYSKALELDPNDADLLTDQGIMFRKIGFFPQAIENFKQASALQPSHINSVFNTYIVARYDLQDFAEAEKAALRYLEMLPNGPNSAQVRAFLDSLKSGTPLQ